MNTIRAVWKFFQSVKLTVVILFAIAATSIIGTFIPQRNEIVAEYYRQHLKPLYHIFHTFNFFDMYHSWWFQALLILLALNILACSLDRLSVIWEIVFVKTPSFSPGNFRNRKQYEEFQDSRSPKALEKIYLPAVARRYSYCILEKTKDGFYIFAEKGRRSRLGVYVLHLSIIILLAGALISSIWGFEGFAQIPEGDSVKYIQKKNTDEIYELDFEIRCDDFSVSYYDPGKRMPKEYRSTLTILEKGNPVLQKDILVNDPLQYRGINIFQQSWGKVPAGFSQEEISLNFVSRETGMEYRKKTKINQEILIPESKGSITIYDYTDSATFRGHLIGEAFTARLTQPGGEPFDIILPLRSPNFDKMRGGDMFISIVDLEYRYYTGLQITRDPGVLVVYTGFIVLILGIAVTFFISHQRVFIEVVKKGKGSAVIVAGRSNKNKEAMGRRISTLMKTLSNL